MVVGDGLLPLGKMKPYSEICLMAGKSKDMSSEAFAMNSIQNHHYDLSVNSMPTSRWYLFLK